MWTVPRIWPGETCIILGGGISMPRQFKVPESVIASVIAGKQGPDVYASYMESVFMRHVIAVNMSFKISELSDVLFFGDSGFIKRFYSDILAWKGLRISCADRNPECSGLVHILKRDQTNNRGISWDPTALCWHGNSGAAAINLAVLFGATRIILLGFDMKLDEQNNQHWHKYYTTPVKVVNSVFDSFMNGFPKIASALINKVEVINANPESALTCFPKMAFQDIKL